MKSEAMEFKSEEEEDDKGKDSALFGCPPPTATEAAVTGIADSNSCGGKKKKWKENEKLEQCSNSRKKL